MKEACSEFQAGESIELETGVRLNFEEVGRGDRAVVYLHGFGASIRNWDDVRPNLPEDWRHLFIDLRGSGFSMRGKKMTYSVDDHATDIAGFIQAKSLRQIVLVGHSYGGAIALLTLRELERRGEASRVIGLVLIDSAGYAAADTYPLYHLRAPLWGSFVVNFIPPRLQARSTLEKAFVNKERITESLLARYTCFYSDPLWREALVAAARAAVPPNAEEVRGWFSSIRVPTLIIWGGGDRMIPVQHASRFATAIRSAHVEILPNVGHVPQEEDPEAVEGLISGFLKSLGERQ